MLPVPADSCDGIQERAARLGCDAGQASLATEGGDKLNPTKEPERPEILLTLNVPREEVLVLVDALRLYATANERGANQIIEELAVGDSPLLQDFDRLQSNAQIAMDLGLRIRLCGEANGFIDLSGDTTIRSTGLRRDESLLEFDR